MAEILLKVKREKEKRMAKAKLGDTVKVHYTGRLDDGVEFDTSSSREPLEFTIGGKQVIQGFENGIVGMEINESKTITIPAGEAYGLYREELALDVPIDQFPPNIKPELGQQLQLTQPNGEPINVMITQITESAVTLDANHPLAGKDLTFDIQLMEIA